HGKRQELLKGFLHAGAGEAEVDDDQNEGNRCVHDERGVGGGISGMNLAEPVRQVGIEAGDKGNAGRAAKPGRTDSGDGQTEHEGGELEANKAKTDGTEGVQNEARVRWNPEVRRSQGSAEAQPDNDTQGNQQDTGDKGAEAADVVDPFANAKADDVEDHENDEQRERS